MSRFRSEKTVALLFKGLIALVVWGVIAVGVWKYLGDEWGPKSDVTAFDPEAALYSEEYPWLEPPLEGGVHIRAKAVVVDITDCAVLPLTFELPGDIAAHHPGEVGTVIQVERLLEEVGVYGDQAPAYRQNALVRLVDLGLGCTIGEAFIQGGEPPEEKPDDGPGFGALPDDQIPALVAHVPRIAPSGARVAGNTARGGQPGVYAGSAFQTTPPPSERDRRRRTASAASGNGGAGRDSDTLDITKRLAQGMTVDDAVACLGEPLRHAVIGSGAREMTRYTWRLPDGRTLVCSFRSNSLQKWEFE